MAANYLQPAAYGRPKSICFLDLDTICWTIATQRQLVHGPAAPLPSVAHVKVLSEQRRLVVTCERAVVLLDIVSKRVRSYTLCQDAFPALPPGAPAARARRCGAAAVRRARRSTQQKHPELMVQAWASQLQRGQPPAAKAASVDSSRVFRWQPSAATTI